MYRKYRTTCKPGVLRIRGDPPQDHPPRFSARFFAFTRKRVLRMDDQRWQKFKRVVYTIRRWIKWELKQLGLRKENEGEVEGSVTESARESMDSEKEMSGVAGEIIQSGEVFRVQGSESTNSSRENSAQDNAEEEADADSEITERTSPPSSRSEKDE
ncbi:hypothetical protein K505DRAFT_338534 [Melanomma pulvis-pyrius CBS 109.77]|uniref:Uncharacterized protein n=1 Tax=Melanomma pulvis-pyrius CBS 109.77 TaxID=1314802 RepID=A0A6A6X948_9PLEO|nr:hypothetical protein K505DRAFT_338534 [Melanomma pulvis-pyrius CBS 109.77]